MPQPRRNLSPQAAPPESLSLIIAIRNDDSARHLNTQLRNESIRSIHKLLFLPFKNAFDVEAFANCGSMQWPPNLINVPARCKFIAFATLFSPLSTIIFYLKYNLTPRSATGSSGRIVLKHPLCSFCSRHRTRNEFYQAKSSALLEHEQLNTSRIVQRVW